MKNKIFKQLAFLFALVLLFSSAAFINAQPVHAEVINNAVTITAIDDEGETILPLSAVRIEKGDNAFDVLETAAKKHGVELKYSEHEFGKMINQIDGKAGQDDFYWQFNVNGTSAKKGVSSYSVSSGEHLGFVLTDQSKPSIKVKVSALNSDGKPVIPETSVNLMQGATAYGALIQAAEKADVSVKSSIDDKLYPFITNVGKVDLGKTGDWNVARNNKALETSIVAQKVQSGDDVQLYVKSYNPPPEPEDDKNQGDEDEEPSDDKNEQPETSEPESVTAKNVQTTIDGLVSLYNSKDTSLGIGSEWWVWGLASSGQKIPDSYVSSVKDKLAETKDFRSIYTLEKIIMGLSASGIDASTFQDRNLLKELENHKAFEKDPLINAAIYGLLAIDSGNYDVNKEFTNRLVDSILKAEIKGGGWAFFGDTPSPDITGMALSALEPYKDRSNVQQAINRGVAYLSKSQDEAGGYPVEFNGGDSSESVSQVIIGLASVGVNPTSTDFTKEGGNLLQHLLKFKGENGGFKHLMDDKGSNPFASQQALMAFQAYQNLQNGDGSVYQFALKKEPEPDTPDKGGDGTPDEPDEGDGGGTPDKDPSGDDKNDNTTNPDQDKKPDDDSLNDNEDNQKDNSTKEEEIKSEESSGQNGEKLPDTATNMWNYLLAGVVLIIVGSIVYFVYRRKTA